MKILVIGATGSIGQQLVAQATAAGQEISTLVRGTARARFAPSLKRFVGDVLDPESLRRALHGQEAVVCSLGSAATGPFKSLTLLSEGTRHLLAAMQTQGVPRLVCITGIGAGESRGHGPWWYNWLVQPLVLRGVYQDKTRQSPRAPERAGLDAGAPGDAHQRGGQGCGGRARRHRHGRSAG